MTTERDGSKIWTCPKPMLAWAKPPEIPIDHYGALGWSAEPKVDGIRITFRVRGGGLMAWTRPGPDRPDGKIRQLPRPVADVACRLPEGVYDAEMAVAGGTSGDAVSKGADDQKALYLFDILETIDAAPTVRLSQKDRRDVLAIALQAIEGQQIVQLVPVVPCTTEQYIAVLDAGGEGLMLKHPDGVYRPGARTKTWLKVKPTLRAVLRIVGYEPAVRGPQATLVLHDESGIEITVGTRNELLPLVTANPPKYIGRPVVVKYRMRTKHGSYLNPRMDWEQTAALWKKERLR